MERMRFRSTSTTDLQAELHERDLLAEIERRPHVPIRRHRPTYGLHLIWARVWRGRRP